MIAFAWEPAGQRFCLITSNDPNIVNGQLPKTIVTFYGYDQRKGDFLSLRSFPDKTVNNVYWSPKGRHCLLATLGSNTKFDVDFFDLDLDREDAAKANEADPGAAIRLVTTVEAYGMTDVEWDPSGRYVATYGSMWTASVSCVFFTAFNSGNPLISPILRARADGVGLLAVGLPWPARRRGQG